MTGDIFTKNLPLSLFEYHGHKVYSLDKYYYESKTKKGKTCLKLIDYHKWIANDHLLIIENASNTIEASLSLIVIAYGNYFITTNTRHISIY